MEELIEAVRGHQELYDPHHPNYLKLYIKDSIWQDIADELNYPDGAQAKLQWSKLRNCHRDALRRKERTAIGRPWKYEREMEFLLKHMVMAHKTQTENIPDPLSDNDTSSESRPPPKQVTNRKRRKTNCDLVDIQAELSQKSEDEVVDPMSSTAENDDLYHFYMSMFNITKQLPLSKQIQIKRKIFDLVTAEQEQMCNRSTTGTSSVFIKKQII